MAFMSVLQTPCLLLDLDIMQRNIASMANRTRHLGVALRPHIKTPKSIPVTLALQAAGAQDFTFSTLKEAEYLFSAGLDGFLRGSCGCEQSCARGPNAARGEEPRLDDRRFRRRPTDR